MTIYPNRRALVHEIHKDRHFKRMLYIGVSRRRPTDFRTLRRITEHITVLEIWPPYIANKKVFAWANEVIEGDIRTHEIAPDYDIIVWWHGPEHMERGEAIDVINRLSASAPLVWLATPWGVFTQGITFGNPYEEHKSTWYPEDFEALGYTAGVCGTMNQRGSQLIAWRENEARPA